jgi:2-methylcitrate dehydratase PrpD
MSTAAQLPAAGTDGLEIIARCAAATFRDVDAETLHHARRCLVDWTGLVIAGLREAPVRIITETVATGGVAGILGARDLTATPEAAALVMGAAGHVLDYDDTDHVNLVHVSTTLFPALFAQAARQRTSGRDLLAAVVAAYEAEDRLGAYLGRPLTARGWHVTGVVGRFGAALACTLAAGGDAARARQAMAIAATGASGLIAAFGTMCKALQVGRIAADGVMAAALAARDFTGPTACLGDGGGFTRPLIGETVADWSGIEEAWGLPYAIGRNSFKPHASCMITHPAIDAAIVLRGEMERAGLAPDAVERVTARVNPLVPKVAGIARPASGLQGKFSVAYCITVGMREGRATPDVFTDEAAAAARLDHIAIEVAPDVGEQQAELELRAGGRIFRAVTAMARGNPANPMSDDELSAKFIALARPSLGDQTASTLARLWAFSDVADVAGFTAELRAHMPHDRRA